MYILENGLILHLMIINIFLLYLLFENKKDLSLILIFHLQYIAQVHPQTFLTAAAFVAQAMPGTLLGLLKYHTYQATP